MHMPAAALVLAAALALSGCAVVEGTAHLVKEINKSNNPKSSTATANTQPPQQEQPSRVAQDEPALAPTYTGGAAPRDSISSQELPPPPPSGRGG